MTQMPQALVHFPTDLPTPGPFLPTRVVRFHKDDLDNVMNGGSVRVYNSDDNEEEDTTPLFLKFRFATIISFSSSQYSL